MPNMKKKTQGSTSSLTMPHRILLGVVAAVDAYGIFWLLTHEVTKMASRKGIIISQNLVWFAVAYLVVLIAINAFGIFRITRLTNDSQAAAKARAGRLNPLSELILFAGMLTMLVGILLLAPGTAVWLVIVSLVLIILGGIVTAFGIVQTSTRFALAALRRRELAAMRASDKGGRPNGTPQPQEPARPQGSPNDESPEPARQQGREDRRQGRPDGKPTQQRRPRR